MPREQLRELANDVNRLLSAGSGAAAGDAALRKRGEALRALCTLDGKAGRPLCLRARAEGDTPLKVRALECLTLLVPAGAARLAPGVQAQEPPEPLRVAAVKALANGRGSAALNALLVALDGPFGVWIAAAHALGSPRCCSPSFAGRSPGWKPGTRGRKRIARSPLSIISWARWPLVAVPELLRALRGADASLASNAPLALMQLAPDDAEVQGAIIAAFGHPQSNVRGQCLNAFIDSRRLRAVPVAALVERLGDSEAWVRGRAADALGMLGPGAAPAVAPLAELLSRPNPMGRFALKRIVEALGKIGPAARAAVPALVEAKRGAKKEVRDAINAAITAITGE